MEKLKLLRRFSSAMNSFPDPRIGAATTDIRYRPIDNGIIRIGVFSQQSHNTHDHARLTITTLRNLLIDPGLLHRMQTLLTGQAFDRRNLFISQVRNRQYAGSHRLAIDMDRAGTALRDPASVFRAGELQNIAQYPEHRHLAVNIDADGFSVQLKLNHAKRPVT